jgi:hypothetical protein
MTTRAVSEDEVRERLRQCGKSDDEIETLLHQYAEAATGNQIPDRDAISDLLSKTRRDSELRVRGFNLTREQYDILIRHSLPAGSGEADQQVSANVLVQKALETFIISIS